MLSGQISHYLIEDQIGTGGMGIVYRARDTRLDRVVAIKATRVESAQGLKRLRKEARVAAAIDHPYICKVFELLEYDDQVLIVMEYVEGVTLGERLEDGSLEISEVLRLGQLVTEALEAIHARGIVHRDVKPSNIMLTGDYIKVMDFGVVLVEKSEDATHAETTTSLTPDGALVGTPYYMAPEQITGDPVDARSDLFALGCVLYQALGGRYPFEGRRRQAYLRNVLTGSPQPLGKIASGVPKELDRVVMRCLQREPDQRYQSAVELGEALERVSQLLSAEQLIDLGMLTAPSRRWKTVAVVAAGAAVLLALGLWFGPGFRDGVSVIVEEERQVTTWVSSEENGRLSPDGHSLSFVSDRDGSKQVWRQPLQGGEATAVTPASDSLILTHGWSPDSSEIAYVTRSRGGDEIVLKIIPASGGRTLRHATLGGWPGDYPRIVRWYDDALFVLVEEKLWRFSSDLTNRSLFSSLDMSRVDVCPHLDTVAYSPPGGRSLTVARLDGSGTRLLTPDAVTDTYPRWGPDDQLFFLSNRSGPRAVWVQTGPNRPPQLVGSAVAALTDVSNDGTTLAVDVLSEQADIWSLDPDLGEHTPLTSDTSSDLWPSSAENRVAFQRIRAGTTGRQDPFDADVFLLEGGVERRLTAGYMPSLSPGGGRIAYLRPSQLGGRHELWVRDLSSGQERRLTDSLPFLRFRLPPPLDRLPAGIAWSGETLLAGLGVPGKKQASLVSYPPDAGSAELLEPGRWSRLSDLHLSPDGRRVSMIAEQDGSYRAVTLEIDGGRLVEIHTEPGGGGTRLYSPGWLNRRRLVLVRSRRSEEFRNRMEILVADIEAQATERVLEGEGFPGTTRLGRNGKLYYTAPADGIHNIYELDPTTRRSRQLTGNQMAGVTFSGLSVSSEGRILYTRHAENRDIKILKLSLQ